MPHSGWRLIDGVLRVVERPGLLEDRVGDGELADVVEQAADREVAEVALREAEALADLHRPERDPARVLLGVGVAPAELDRERADVRAEEALLGVHELGRVEVAGERPRLDAACEVERDRDADDEDAVELEACPSHQPTWT